MLFFGPVFPPAPTSTERLLSFVFLAIAALALAVRVVSIAEPLGIDQSLWASAVRGMARGQLLYRDVWEQRPPGIYLTYLAGFSVFGWRPSTVAWLDILASAATTTLVFAIVRRLSDRLTASVAAALYAAFTMPAWLYRYGGFLERSVCETFICVVVGVSALAAIQLRDRPSPRAALVLGLGAGAAFVLKPNAALYFPLLLSWAVWFGGGQRMPARSISALAGIAVAGAAVIPIAIVVWLMSLGLLSDAKVAVVDFNRFYVAGGFTIPAFAEAFSKAVWLRMKTDPIWLAGSVGAVAAVVDLARRRLTPLPALAVCWGAAAACVMIVNGIRLYNSYFIQAFPPLAIMAAWWLTDGLRGSTGRRLVAAATAVMVLVVPAERSYASKVLGSASTDLAALTGRMDRTTYLEQFGSYADGRGYSARANDELASYVRAHTTENDRIFLFGINGAGVYFLADRLTAHRFLRVNFFVPSEFPNPDFTLGAVLADLEARRPRYVIFETLHSGSEMAQTADALPEHADVKRLLANYTLETRIEDFSLYRLR